MSGSAVLCPFATKMGLAGGLARCSAGNTAHAEADEPVLTTTGSEYGTPTPETMRTQPVRPPPPASVMHRSRGLRFPPISHSHAIHAAPKTRDAERTASISSMQSSNMNATHIHISADRRLETCSTTTGENFQPVLRMLPAATIRKPATEASKFTPYCAADDDWTATYGSAFSRHSRPSACPAQRKRYLVTKNAGCCPLTGCPTTGRECATKQGIGENLTTNCATYRGHSVRDIGCETSPCAKHLQLSNIPHGDPAKVAQPGTTNRATFQPPQPTPGSSYSQSAAVLATFTSSVHLGGTSHINTFSTTMREMFPRPVGRECKQREAIVRVPRNASFLPCGDLDANRVKQRMSHSTAKSTHRVPARHSYPAHVDSSRLHTASSVYLGCQRQPQPPCSTMATSYQPLTAHTQRVGAPIRDNIPFDYYPGHLSNSTAASSYRTHTGDLRHSLAPDTLRNLQSSHWCIGSTQSNLN